MALVAFLWLLRWLHWFWSFFLFHFLAFTGFAVLAACLKAFAVGAPFVPGLRIFSPDPALMRSRFAAILL
jgi:hypothetical protein